MEKRKKEKVEVNCVMKFPINIVWPVFKDTEEQNKVIQDDYKTNIEYLNAKKTYEKGCEFKYVIQNVMVVLATCIDVIEEDKFNYINVKCVVLEPFHMIYNNVFYLYANTIDNTTFIKWEQIYEDIDKLYYSNKYKILEESKLKMKIHLQRIKNYLKKILESKNQIESIIINNPINVIWDLISDFRELIKKIPSVADLALYEGDPLSIGTKLQLKWEEKKVTCFLKVKVIEKDDVKNEWKYVLECYEGTPNIPQQILEFKIKKIDENSCFLTFIHSFKTDIQSDFIKSISKQKKEILRQLSKLSFQKNKFD
jgi:hypothetical protein